MSKVAGEINQEMTHWEPHSAAFAAGAASRDDEVEQLKSDLVKG